MLNNAGTVYEGALDEGALAPGSGTGIGNSQCQVQGALTSVSGSGNVLTIQIRVVFQPAFTGTKAILVESNDGVARTGWHSVGTWAIP